MPPRKKKKEETFEAALGKLEQLLEKLERGDLPLEEAMEAYSEGVRLVKHCHSKLEEAERKVQLLQQNEEGRWNETPFEGARVEDADG